MNNLTDQQIIDLLKQRKSPVQSFIERNKFLASKEYIGLSKEISWVIDKKVAEYIPILIERIEILNLHRN